MPLPAAARFTRASSVAPGTRLAPPDRPAPAGRPQAPRQTGLRSEVGYQAHAAERQSRPRRRIPACRPASSVSDRRQAVSASSFFPAISSTEPSAIRLRATSTFTSTSAPGSDASASRAARTDRCAASASSSRPTLAVSSASSKFEAASARRAANSVSFPSRPPSLL